MIKRFKTFSIISFIIFLLFFFFGLYGLSVFNYNYYKGEPWETWQNYKPGLIKALLYRSIMFMGFGMSGILIQFAIISKKLSD
jgi:hypothetical protein